MECPEEIYQLILSYVSSGITRTNGQYSHTSYMLQKPLHHSVALVSKQFHRLITPFMYRELRITSFDDKGVRLLLRTLAERPGFARMVLNLDLACWDIADFDSTSLADLSHEMLAVLTKISLRDSPSRKRLRHDVQIGLPDAYVAILLLLCTQLTDCKFVVPPDFDQSLVNLVRDGSLRQVVAAGEASKPPFHQLRHLNIEHWATEGTYDIDLALWLRLSALETFHGFALDLNFGDAFSVPSPFSNVKHIVVLYSLMDANGLQWLLRTCPALETLQVEWGSSTVGVSEIERPAIGTALNTFGKSLRVLEFDASGAFYTDEEDLRPLSSISDMTALTSLIVGYEFLFCDENDIPIDSDGESVISANSRSFPLTNMLPPSLRFLKITACRAEIADEVESSIRTLLADERFESLQRVTLGVRAPIFQDALPDEWTMKKKGSHWLELRRHVQRESPVMVPKSI